MLAAPAYAACALVTLLAIVIYMVTTFNVGRARTKYGVPPPRTDGPEDFLRVFRVQANTLEQLAGFIPALWIFALYLSPFWASIIGLVWCAARVGYAIGYCRAVKYRLPGFVIALLCTAILIVGGAVGVLQVLFAG